MRITWRSTVTRIIGAGSGFTERAAATAREGELRLLDRAMEHLRDEKLAPADRNRRRTAGAPSRGAPRRTA
jgi:5,10-methenyltetrahydromethanopterin hydrogenase